MPLFLRISATDWLDEVAKSDSSAPQESWTVADTVRLADELADLGVDVLDVSSGGNHPKQHPHTGPAYQAPFAHAVKEKCGDRLHVMSVGSITTGPQAEELMQKGLDMVACGRTFQKDPGLVWTFAEQLGVEINLANQIRYVVVASMCVLEDVLMLTADGVSALGSRADVVRRLELR